MYSRVSKGKVTKGAICHGSGWLAGSSCCLCCPVRFGSSWSGQSVLIGQQECTDHELTLLHLLLIPPLTYMSLLYCSSLWVDCFALASVLCTSARIFLLPSVPLCCRIRSTEIRQLVWSADTAGQLWNLRFPKQQLNIVYVILCFVARITFLLFLKLCNWVLYHPNPDTISYLFKKKIYNYM